MITVESQNQKYLARFNNGKIEGLTDQPVAKGGQGLGFTPYDLLEAALANCMNVWARLYADHHGIPLIGIKTQVELFQENSDETFFKYNIELEGDLTPEQKEKLIHIAKNCPIHKTISKKITLI